MLIKWSWFLNPCWSLTDKQKRGRLLWARTPRESVNVWFKMKHGNLAGCQKQNKSISTRAFLRSGRGDESPVWRSAASKNNQMKKGMHYTATRAAAAPEYGRQRVRGHRRAAPSSQHTTKVETGGQTPALQRQSERLCCPLFVSAFLWPLRRLSIHAPNRARAGASAEIRGDIALRGQKKRARGFVRSKGVPTVAQRGLPAAFSFSATGSWLPRAQH